MSPPRPLLLLLSVLLLTLCYVTLLASATCNVDDEEALLGFKSGITADPSGMLQSWKSGTDCCRWVGVTCLVGGRVTSLSLTGNPDQPNSFLSGTISSSLAKAQNLDGLYFTDLRNLSGLFPEFISRLPNLLFVYLQNNNLSGPIPATIGNLTRLSSLVLSGNRFTGTIPSSVSELTQLTQLSFAGNLLTGSVPPGIARLRNLTLLRLDQNRLSGPIPEMFSSLTQLRTLNLTGNRFSGAFPASIAALAPRLAYLELGENALAGRIPDFLGNFTALDTLDLSGNRFSGTVPKSFRNLTKIFNLDLSDNLLVDPFPEMFVKGIESLDLSNNQFHLGEIPKWVTSSPIIDTLRLAKCGLKFKLDDWNPAQTYYYDYIDLSGNQISGSPVGLLNRTDFLAGFWAGNNLLKFDAEALRLGRTLKDLDLSRNSVFGKLPAAISGLHKLNVSYNHLCGKIPVTQFPASAFAGNDCLCGSPLSACKS